MKIQRHYRTRRNLVRVLMFTAAVFSLAIQASAAPAGGGLPWEAPMTAIATSLTGPVAVSYTHLDVYKRQTVRRILSERLDRLVGSARHRH